MNVEVVAAADRSVLVRFAVAAAKNAQDLVEEAELLLAAGRHSRAYSLAALAVEEVGKAGGLVTLTVMPDEMRAQAPIKQLLEWHALKQIGGLLIGAMDISTPGLTGRIAETPPAQLAEVLTRAAQQAAETDQAKKRGFYVDLDGAGQLHEPSGIGEDEARDAVARARNVVANASMLNDPLAQSRLADPPQEALALASVLFGSYMTTGRVDTAEDAAGLITGMAKNLVDDGDDPVPGESTD